VKAETREGKPSFPAALKGEAHNKPQRRQPDMRIITAVAPSHWASYLINGDRSVWEDQPDPADEAECQRMQEELGWPVDCEEIGFCWTPDYGRPGECCEYKFIVRD